MIKLSFSKFVRYRLKRGGMKINFPLYGLSYFAKEWATSFQTNLV